GAPQAGEQRLRLRRLLAARLQPERDRYGWQVERITEGEELLELRALDSLRRKAAGGEQPAALARIVTAEGDAHRRPRRAREERALQAPAEVERDLPAAGAQLPEDWRDRPQALVAAKDQDLVEPGVRREERGRERLDGPPDPCVGPGATDPTQQREGA